MDFLKKLFNRNKLYAYRKRKIDPQSEAYVNAMSFMSESNEDEEGKRNLRENWKSNYEFLVSCVSFSVGLGNIWRFPYIVYENGGGAFLIPFFTVMIIVGRPLYYFELAAGQFSGQGPIQLWRCVPAFQGIGYAQLITCAYRLMYFNYLIGLIVFYIAASMHYILPWSVCDPAWANHGNCTNQNLSNNYSIRIPLAEQYWLNYVLRSSSGLDMMTTLDWRLSLCVLTVWIVLFLCVFRGIASLGKVSYVTTIFPHVTLIALLGFSLSRSGGPGGFVYFFKPKWEMLRTFSVWYRACEQAFFSLGVGSGSLIMYASYNDFRNNASRAAIVLICIDIFTCLLAGCVIFSVLGDLSNKMNVDISEVVSKRGMGLAFISYSEGLARIKYVPQLWSVLFFLMLFSVGIGNSNATLETILTCVKDEYPSLRKKTWLPAGVACIVGFFLSLPLATDAGQYVMLLLDSYCIGTIVILFGLLELVGLMWVYGSKAYSVDLEFMTKKSLSGVWKLFWSYVTPFSVLVVFVYGLVWREEPRGQGIHIWGNQLGWGLAWIALIQLPGWMIYKIWRTRAPKWRNKFRLAFKPSAQWGPKDREHYIGWLHYKSVNMPE